MKIIEILYLAARVRFRLYYKFEVQTLKIRLKVKALILLPSGESS